jgi:DNA-binding transcriptional LysR family regulator
MLDLTIGAPKELERQVLEDRLHVAVFPEYWLHDGLDYRPLYQERVGLFAAPGHPATREATPEGVRRHSLVHRSIPEPEGLTRRKAAFPEGARVEATEAVLALVLAGCHLGFMPAHLGRSQGLVELFPATFGYALPMCLIHRRDRPPSRLVAALLRAVDGLQPGA